MDFAIYVFLLSLIASSAHAQAPQPGVGIGASFFTALPPSPSRAPSFSLSAAALETIDSECAALPTRTLTGRCTSALDPNLGEARRAQFSYLDVDSRNFAGEGLKSARIISNIVSNQSGNTLNSLRLNELFVFFGQFIDHDFALSPLSDVEMDIEVPENDPDLNVDHLRFERSSRGLTSAGNNLPFNTGGFANSPSTLLEDAFPNMTSGSMYETARAINIAQYQKIIYEEWLPAILGRSLPRYIGYKENINPTISVELTTAGFRVGHTMVGNGVSRIDSSGKILPIITMEDMFFRDSNLSGEDIENFIRGAAGTRAQEVDTMVVDALRNFLFSSIPEEPGFDLIALNIQRGRDHNVPRFNELRRFFLGAAADSFSQITSDSAVQQKLQDAYGSVDNVEAWPGLMAEDKQGAVGLGRTNAELWRREFTRLRDGDRFFYLDNARHNQIPKAVLDALPEINVGIFSSQSMFSRILRRTTSLKSGDISTGINVFRV
ncbi:unnamed protein product [Agarophyton chilense]